MRGLRVGFAWQAGADVDGQLDLLAEAAEDRHQPIDRETGEIDVADSYELAMSDPAAGLGLPGGQTLSVEDLDDLRREQRLGLAHIGVGKAEIAEHVAAAAYDVQRVVGTFGHCTISLTRRSRASITSISCFGVLIPVLDFFWNAWITHTSAPSCTA